MRNGVTVLAAGLRAPLRAAAAALFCALALCAGASAQEFRQGVALVIGQSDYDNLGELGNPTNDALAIYSLLDRIGFDAEPLINADAEELAKGLYEFAEKAAGADVAFIYYAGHGIEIGGENYLIPTDADVSTPEAAGQNLVPLSPLLRKLQETVPVAIVLLDACRTSPFPAGQLVVPPGGTTPVAVSAEGLAEARGFVLTQSDPAANSIGTVIGFAAEPGRVALDSVDGSDNSPYASALIEHLSAGGYDFGQLMTLVSQEVYLDTETRQLPWVNSSLREFLTFGPPVEETQGDEALIRDGRRGLLLTIASVPQQQRDAVEAVAGSRDLTLDSIYAMLNALGVEASSDPVALQQQLEAAADSLAQMFAEREALEHSDRELEELRALAKRAFDEGALDAALELARRAQQRADELRPAQQETARQAIERVRETAEATADVARYLGAAFRYTEAAAEWERAYTEIREFDQDRALNYRLWQGWAYGRQGYEDGDNDGFRAGIPLLEEAAARMVPGDGNWSWTHFELGSQYNGLGARTGDTALLQEALAVYEHVRDNTSRETALEVWAEANERIASVVKLIGERDPNTDRLAESLAAAEAAAEVFSRDENPEQWADKQNMLALGYSSLGARTRDVAVAEQAVARFEEVLAVVDAKTSPRWWATLNGNLASALNTLGSLTGEESYHHRALAAHQAALTIRAPDRLRLDWSDTMEDIAITYEHLDSYDGASTAYLEQAVDYYLQALSARSPENTPIFWANGMANLGNALRLLGAANGDALTLQAAESAFEAAFGELTRERNPLAWANEQRRFGLVLTARWNIDRTETSYLDRAFEAYTASGEIMTLERSPWDWARNQSYVGYNYGNHYVATRDPIWLPLKIAAFKEAIDLSPTNTPRWLILDSHRQYGEALLEYARAHEDERYERDGIAAYRNWIALTEDGGEPTEVAAAWETLAGEFERMRDYDAQREALGTVADWYKRAADAVSPESDASRWASLMSSYGNALRLLGRASSFDRHILQSAETALVASLTVSGIPAADRHWPLAEFRLGMSRLSQWIGERNRGREQPSPLDGAIHAYDRALLVWTPESDPVDWASALRDMGYAYLNYYTTISDPVMLAHAAATFQSLIDNAPPAAPGWIVEDAYEQAAYATFERSGWGEVDPEEGFAAYRRWIAVVEARGDARDASDAYATLAEKFRQNASNSESPDFYRDAAVTFEQALAVLPAGQEDADVWWLRDQQASALLDFGYNAGDRSAIDAGYRLLNDWVAAREAAGDSEGLAAARFALANAYANWDGVDGPSMLDTSIDLRRSATEIAPRESEGLPRYYGRLAELLEWTDGEDAESAATLEALEARRSQIALLEVRDDRAALITARRDYAARLAYLAGIVAGEGDFARAAAYHDDAADQYRLSGDLGDATWQNETAFALLFELWEYERALRWDDLIVDPETYNFQAPLATVVAELGRAPELVSGQPDNAVFLAVNAARIAIAEGMENAEPALIQGAIDTLAGIGDPAEYGWAGTLDPELCSAHASLARLSRSYDDWRVAEAACQTAAEGYVYRPSAERNLVEAQEHLACETACRAEDAE